MSALIPLIDDLLPVYQFSEIHSCQIAATPTKVIERVPGYRPDLDPFFKTAIALRELSMRLSRKANDCPPPFGFDDFTLIGRRDDEIVYGLVGQFWQSDFGLRNASGHNLHRPT